MTTFEGPPLDSTPGIGAPIWAGFSSCALGRLAVLALTSRYYKPEMLQSFVEYNFLRFVARRVAEPAVFAEVWRDAVVRLMTTRAVPALTKPVVAGALSLTSMP